MSPRYWQILPAVIVALWAALYLSSNGVLVFSRQHRPLTADQDVLTCTYFTGISFIDREFWYSSGNVFGRSICPRLLSFRHPG